MNEKQKAQAYDEALERAKKQRADYQKELDKTDKESQLAGILSAGISALDMAFPELRESEDEKIRQGMIRFLESEQAEGIFTYEARQSWIAYLERQKEHSMSAEEVLARAGLKPYKDGNKWCILAGDNIQDGICGFGDTIDEALYQFLLEVLEKQKEQKPAEWSEVELEFRGEKVKVKRPFYRDDKGRGYSTAELDEEVAWNALRAWCEKKGISLYDLYPKAEWNEEDEKMRNLIVAIFKVNHPDGFFKANELGTTDMRGVHTEEIISWLKSLCPQPKQEWSEEDADILNCCISSIEEAKENRYAYKETDGDTSYDREIAWLKSLCPSKNK